MVMKRLLTVKAKNSRPQARSRFHPAFGQRDGIPAVAGLPLSILLPRFISVQRLHTSGARSLPRRVDSDAKASPPGRISLLPCRLNRRSP